MIGLFSCSLLTAYCSLLLLSRPGGEDFGGPKSLLPGVGLTVLAGIVAGDGADGFGAGVQMDEDIRGLAEMGLENFLQVLDLPVAFFQGEVSGQNQVKIHVDAIAGAAGPKLGHVNPGGLGR